jgi:methanogenic corrinoid protein MtbC1
MNDAPAQKDSHTRDRSLQRVSETATTADRYLEAVLAGDRRLAMRTIDEAVQAGTSVREIYLNVFQWAQHELGRLWEENQISVAEEHFATAVTQLCMSQLYDRILSTERNGRTLVAACIGGELHEIGVRMVADFFEMDGWDSHYLGASTPPGDIVETIEKVRADAVALSAAMSFNVKPLTELVGTIRNAELEKRPLILVGGRPFNVDPDLWRRVGADLSAPDAASAVAAVENALGKPGGER